MRVFVQVAAFNLSLIELAKGAAGLISLLDSAHTATSGQHIGLLHNIWINKELSTNAVAVHGRFVSGALNLIAQRLCVAFDVIFVTHPL